MAPTLRKSKAVAGMTCRSCHGTIAEGSDVIVVTGVIQAIQYDVESKAFCGYPHLGEYALQQRLKWEASLRTEGMSVEQLQTSKANHDAYGELETMSQNAEFEGRRTAK
jgi:hypothetical protein